MIVRERFKFLRDIQFDTRYRLCIACGKMIKQSSSLLRCHYETLARLAAVTDSDFEADENLFAVGN